MFQPVKYYAKIFSQQVLSFLLPGCFVVLFFLHHFFFSLGHFGYYDMQYAESAVQLLQGNIDSSYHFSFRIALVASVAFFISCWLSMILLRHCRQCWRVLLFWE